MLPSVILPSLAKAELTGAVFMLLFLAGCNHGARQQRLAADTVERLRDNFNKRDCGSMYALTEGGSDELRSQWLNGCQQMQEDLGSWENFVPVSIRPLSQAQKRAAILVEGSAVFVNGNHRETYWMESYWHVDDDHARLYYVYFEGGGKQIALPHLFEPFPGPRDLPSGVQAQANELLFGVIKDDEASVITAGFIPLYL